MGFQRIVHRASKAVESVQVELHGQYSVERLRKLNHYCGTTSYTRVLLVLLAVPLPCLVVIVLTDSIPLKDPALGLRHSGLFWLRSALGSRLVLRVVHSAGAVPPLRSETQDVVRTGDSHDAGGHDGDDAHRARHGVCDRIPRTVHDSRECPRTTSSARGLVQLEVGKVLREDPATREELVRYLAGLTAQTSLTVIYPVFNFVFINLDSTGQTALAMVLPVIKMGMKNWISYTFSHLEDLKPEMVIFNVDLFHALFVACCMQSSTSSYMIIFLTLVDFVQAVLSLSDINGVLRQISILRSRIKTKLPTMMADSTDHSMTMRSALHLLNSDEQLDRHPSVITAARHATFEPTREEQELHAKSPAAMVNRLEHKLQSNRRIVVTHHHRRASVGPVATTELTPKQSIPAVQDVATDDPQKEPRVKSGDEMTGKAKVHAQATTTKTSGDNHEAAVASAVALNAPKYVQQVLRLLYLTEFVLMIEFAEVVIPVIYCEYPALIRARAETHDELTIALCLPSICLKLAGVYIVMAYNLPNREFYKQFADTDFDHVVSNIPSVMRYVGLELLSFVLFHYAVHRRIRFSTLHQIAFLFESQWGSCRPRSASGCSSRCS